MCSISVTFRGFGGKKRKKCFFFIRCTITLSVIMLETSGKKILKIHYQMSATVSIWLDISIQSKVVTNESPKSSENIETINLSFILTPSIQLRSSDNSPQTPSPSQQNSLLFGVWISSIGWIELEKSCTEVVTNCEKQTPEIGSFVCMGRSVIVMCYAREWSQNRAQCWRLDSHTCYSLT